MLTISSGKAVSLLLARFSEVRRTRKPIPSGSFVSALNDMSCHMLRTLINEIQLGRTLNSILPKHPASPNRRSSRPPPASGCAKYSTGAIRQVRIIPLANPSTCYDLRWALPVSVGCRSPLVMRSTHYREAIYEASYFFIGLFIIFLLAYI